MIQKRLAILVLCGALAVGGGGCVLVSQNPFDLTPREIATLQVKFGPDLTAAPRGELEAAVEKLTDIDVASLQVSKNKVTVIPTPAALEIGRRSIPSLIDNIVANPTPYGIAGGVLGLFGIGVGVVTRRAARAKKKEKKT